VLRWLADGPCQAGELTRRLGCHPTRFRTVTRPLIDAGLIVRARYYYRLPDQRVEPRAPAGWDVVAAALTERPHSAHELAKMTGRTLQVMRVWLYRAEAVGRLERVGDTWILTASNGDTQ
jgi:predicted Rossmann fold nucleotide-binding protein DprA/Smf involved in DNA uptake